MNTLYSLICSWLFSHLYSSTCHFKFTILKKCYSYETFTAVIDHSESNENFYYGEDKAVCSFAFENKVLKCSFQIFFLRNSRLG